MYHDLPRSTRFWLFLLAVDLDLAETTRRQGCSCGGRLHRANYLRKPRGTPVQLPEEQRLRLSFCCDRDGCRKRVTPPSVRLPWPQGLLGPHRHPYQCHAAGTNTAPHPRVIHTLPRQPADHRPLAGFLARALSANTVLETRTRPSGAVGRDHQPAVLARGFLSRSPSSLSGLDASTTVSLADHDPRRPENRGFAMMSRDPQRMLIA